MSKTLAEKLQIKPHTTVWLSDPGHVTLLTPMPEGVRESDQLATASTAIMFADDAATAHRLMETHQADLTKPAVLWVAYPKGGRADINRDTLWPIIAEFGLRPNSQVAIDDHWSALRFRADEPGEAPFTAPGPSPR
ncbi:hypothetical protein [Actinoplanes sp. NBRC 103695]|uniref:hypothetical protein n=1 Tax=Actinoplanes sp. NBRC 103695 TaxID=3032202 RepID=UPI0024A3FA37|nr:hypothetical protein [Actinoplanes sp. NBRC 103695]GLY96223.1 hypothetical protein Acsp02_34780 [Actinoplanes sp. NBRC 103695]